MPDYQDDKHRSDNAIISFNQDFEGKQTVSVTDDACLLKGATATTIDKFNTSIEFSFTIIKPFATSSIIVESWDANHSSRSNVFLDAVKAYGNPIIEKATPQPVKNILALKQVKAIIPRMVECREGFDLVIRSATGMPSCAYPLTAEILRNWEMVVSS